MVPQKSRSSTSDTVEWVGIKDLRYELIGRRVAVTGRDITLGLHGGPSLTQIGVLETIRMRKGRVVLVMGMTLRGRPVQMRTIEMTE